MTPELIEAAALLVGAALLPLLILAGFVATLLAAFGASTSAFLRGEASLLAPAELLVRIEAFEQKLRRRDDLFRCVFLADAEGCELFEETLDLLQLRQRGF